MTTKKIVLKGNAYWARVYEGSHDEYGGKEFYKITVDLDGDSWGKFSRSGMTLQSRPVEKDSDIKGITFRRDIEGKEFKDAKTGKVKVLGGGPPRVVDKDGQVMTDLIGNGSEIEVLVEVYETKSKPPKIGHRLEAVKVLKIVHYEPPEDDDDDSIMGSGSNSSGSFADLDEPPVKQEVAKKSKRDLPF